MNDLLYYIFRFYYFLVTHTPKKLKKIIIDIFAFLVWHLDFFRKKVVLKNLEIAFPKMSKKERIKIAKQFYKNFIFYMTDIIDSLNISKEELRNKVIIKEEQNLKLALNSNKPIVFMTAHFGNWEVAPKVIGAFYKEMVVLMREFDNPKIGEFFKKSRSSFNISPLNKKKSAREIIKAFKENKALGVLIDQHSTSNTAIEVEFFNKKVKFNRGISTLAKKFDAIIVPMFTYFENGKYILEFQTPREFRNGDTIESFTQWQATTIENMIKRYPSEYYWFHKRFKNIEGIYK